MATNLCFIYKCHWPSEQTHYGWLRARTGRTDGPSMNFGDIQIGQLTEIVQFVGQCQEPMAVRIPNTKWMGIEWPYEWLRWDRYAYEWPSRE